jgi:hypothetical protein
VSSEFGAVDSGDDVVLFSFPAEGGNYFVHEVLMDVSEAFTDVGGITEVGYGTLTEAGVLTTSDTLRYFQDAEDILTNNVIGVYPLGVTDYGVTLETTGSTWAMAKQMDNTSVADPSDLLLIGAAYDTMPVVYAAVAAAQAVGKARLHMLLSRLQ